ncbi:MAG TPA: CDP-diacylglycerol--serine O-phosphatidyltransferase [Acidobacteriaceae bacterium]|nr:CDP-diacylglycerol--serine O-phosphatidyltransferase [Acidobacteriaceae bacterium]
MSDHEQQALFPHARRRRARGLYLLPSMFTAVNIGAGFFAIMQSLEGSALEPHHFDYAAVAIGLAIPFDALDGRIARMTNTESDFGRELDSLADVVTFGVAPAILAFAWGFRSLPQTLNHDFRAKLIQFGAFVCFLFLLCGAARLARFNISVNPVPKNPGHPGRKYFVGMPIPAGAALVAAVVHGFIGLPIFSAWVAMIWGALVGFLGFLMVSTWRFWSGKEINLAGRQPFRWIVLLGVGIYLLVFFSREVLILLAFAYMFSGVIARLAYSWRRHHPRQQSQPLPSSIEGPNG